jgi:hypothetical protein
MRLKIIAVESVNKAINKARIDGKLSLVAVAKLNMLRYYMEFALEQIGLGKEDYKDKYQALVNKYNNLVFSCPDIICNVNEASCGTENYEFPSTIVKNPYGPTSPNVDNPEPDPDPVTNNPPTIGDNTILVENNVVTVLTLDMFTTNTIGPYSDPEGDLIDAIRIDRIHGTNQGTFYVDGIEITKGQIITREQIDAGKFTHTGADIDTVASDGFEFSARDEGSQIWVQ